MNTGDNTLIEESFVSDPKLGISGAHYDAVQTNSATGFTVLGSTVLGRWQAQTSAIFLQGNNRWSGIGDIYVEGNFFSGGNYTMYLTQGDEHPPATGIVVRDNLWNAGSWQYGARRISNLADDLVWEHNRTTDGHPVD